VQDDWREGPVVAAFIEHDEPRLDEAVRRLELSSERDIIVVPLLLSRAFHGRVDVPAAVAAARATSQAEIACADVIGADERLLPALDRALPTAAPVVLAVAGTRDAVAQHDFDALAAKWSMLRGAPVIVGHASQAEPDIATAIDAIETMSGTEAAIASFVLFEGVLPDRIRAVAGNRCVTPPLFTSPELVGLVIDRAHAARPAQVSR
jgi:sirohydrochlorin ferrochelatase